MVYYPMFLPMLSTLTWNTLRTLSQGYLRLLLFLVGSRGDHAIIAITP